MSILTDRALLIRAVAASFDDSTPVLVLADCIEEEGTPEAEEHAQMLRWYALEVMPVIEAVPAECPAATIEQRHRALKELGQHPQADRLLRLAAVAFCRRPCVWDQLTDERSQLAVIVARLFALGLASKEERVAYATAAHTVVHASGGAAHAACAAAYAVSAGIGVCGTAAYTAANAHSAYTAHIDAHIDAHTPERGYQVAIVKALTGTSPR